MAEKERPIWVALCFTVSLIAFVMTWSAMGGIIYLILLGIVRSQLPLHERILSGLQMSVQGEMAVVATILCPFNALTQYGLRFSVRRDLDEGKPNPRVGFRWIRALQSVVIAWAFWYAWTIWVCCQQP